MDMPRGEEVLEPDHGSRHGLVTDGRWDLGAKRNESAGSRAECLGDVPLQRA